MARTEEDIARKIDSLLRLSKSPNEAEAALALQKAQELQMRYKLDLEKVQFANRKPVFEITEETLIFGGEDNDTEWCRTLIRGVAKAFFCEAIWLIGRSSAVVMGREIDIQATKNVYSWLSTNAEVMAAVEFQRLMPISPRRIWERDFLEGFAKRMAERLGDNQKALESSEEVKALVKSENRHIEYYKSLRFDNLVGHRAPVRNYSGGYQVGKAGADRVDISQPKRT